ncbi:MAG: cell division protein FtsQ/DivIB, partial [Caulobacteraceae bacterium]
MPAKQRGGSPGVAKPRPKAANKTVSRSVKRGRAVAYAPSKLNAAQSGLRISPALAVAVAGLIVIGGSVAALATGDRMALIGEAVDRQAAQAGFKVSAVHVQGATSLSKEDIVKATGLREGQPILGVDLDAIRGRVEKVGWVTNAKVVRLLPDTIVIAVTQRPAAAVWQHAGHLRVVDEGGKVITEADPADFPNLPLVVGQGAAAASG